ncbi:MAG: L-seryl-tRNA(Sec) selenium transferase [Sarcina sp.]
MGENLLRLLPKMDLLLEEKDTLILIEEFSRELVIGSLRDSLNYYRKSILEGKRESEVCNSEIINLAKSFLSKKVEASLKKVINCTGIVIHTNLGRAPLSEGAVKAIVNIASGYSNLEYDLENGTRGSRNFHISKIIREITRAEDAVVVNNNAAAVMLILNEFAKNKEVVVSRGELVEIGGSFRVPEIMEMSGSYLKEVGTTNRTRIEDYEKAIEEDTAMLLKVHSSNFKIIGFTENVSLEDLGNLGSEKEIITAFDAGSGLIENFNLDLFSEETTIEKALKANIDLVTFSGDKLLGGVQAGIIVGKKIYIDRLKANPLMRALRVDKLTFAALEATLIAYLDLERAKEEIPVLKMLTLEEGEAIKNSEELLNLIGESKSFEFSIEKDNGFVGGGSMPGELIETMVIKITSEKFSPKEIEDNLRNYKVPIIARINKNKVIIDLKTVDKKDYKTIAEALKGMDKL